MLHVCVALFAVSAGFNQIAVEAQEIRKKPFSFREYYKYVHVYT